jgi:DNA adenine methylase
MVQDQAANRTRALVPWIGGKGLLADRIIPLFPPHHCYVEVFAGAGSILFRKAESRVEILNDINLDLVTLYRVIKHHLDEFIRCLRWLLTAREEFERFKATDPATLTDVQRAVRFYYLHRNAFAPGVGNPSFRSGASQPARWNLLRIEEHLSTVHIRLSRVTVENMPYGRLIAMCDKRDTLFYIDPPYYGSESDYGKGLFARSDFAVLAEQLRAIKGRFVLSLNDRAETRRIFKGFSIRAVRTRYYVGDAGGRRARELLITNYRPGAGRGIGWAPGRGITRP